MRRHALGALIVLTWLLVLPSAASLAPVSVADEAPVAPPGSRPLPLPEAPPAGAEQSSRDEVPEGYEQLLSSIGEAEELTAPVISAAVRDYYAASGFDLPPNEFESLDENATITFTYPLGDVDADGFDDIAFNTYCVEYKCFQQSRDGTFPPPLLAPRNRECGTLHRLVGISGANGTPMWENPLGILSMNPTSPPLPYICPIEFVVGTLPTPENRTGLLISSFAVAGPHEYLEGAGFVQADPSRPFFNLEHRIYSVDGRNGEVIWEYKTRGLVLTVATGAYGMDAVYTTAGCYYRIPYFITDRHIRAENLITNAILQMPPEQGVRIVPNGTQPALFVQHVSFNYTLVSKPGSPPGSTCPQYLIESYQPEEWAVRLDMRSGKSMWTKPTFQPRSDLSVIPNILQTTPHWPGDPFPWMYKAPRNDPAYFSSFRGDVMTAISHYWNFAPCCFDLTGDGEADLVYTTTEWYPQPGLDNPGPHMMSARLVLFDGKTGDKAWEQVIEPGTRRFLFPETPVPWQIAYYNKFELAGDLDGDGVSDVLVHQVYLDENYRHVVSARKGTTGEAIWTVDKPRELTALVLGDANGDGGNDVLIMDWFDWEYPGYEIYQLVNVTRTPLILHSGVDGKILWEAETFNAPIDRYLIYQQFKAFGLPDVNGDGVGDVAVDDPVRLPDLTVIHREKYLSGKDAKPLFSFTSVGTFAWPSAVGDYTGDGIDDFAVMSGDLLDLWFTIYDGNGGSTLWSRRLATPRIADYTFAVPRITFHPMQTPNGTAPFVEFQLTVMSLGGFRFSESLYPQAAWVNHNGTIGWAYPKIWDENIWIMVMGNTPASAAFDRSLEEAAAPKGVAKGVSQAAQAVAVASPAAVVFAAATGLGYAVFQWRMKK